MSVNIVKYLFISVVICFLSWNLVIRISQKNQIWEYCNTEFSNDFTDKKWESITNGKSKDEVIKLLGQPLNSFVLPNKIDKIPNAYMSLSFSDVIKKEHFFSGYAYCSHSIMLDSSIRVISKSKFWDED